MINDFKLEYIPLHYEFKRQQFANYFEGGKYNLNIVDEEIFKLVRKYFNRIENTDRESQIANFIIAKNLVDKNPNVSRLINFIDDLDNYDLLYEGMDAKKAKLAKDKRIKEDVVEAMNIRDALAQKNSYESYPDLIFDINGIERETLLMLLETFLEKNINKARETIKNYDISFKTWFRDLDKIGILDGTVSSEKSVNKLLESLGFEDIKDKISIEYGEGQFDFTGFACELAPNKIKVVVDKVTSINDLRTLFHELGHGIFYGLNEGEELFRIVAPSQDETMGVIFEYIGMEIVLAKRDRKIVEEIINLEYTRSAISALFELSLWEKPNYGDELYKYYYEKLGLSIEDLSLWPWDSFRSIDSVYIHNYVIGASYGEKLIEYLKNQYGNDYKLWGKWLKEHLYIDGSSRSIKEKLDFLNGGGK